MAMFQCLDPNHRVRVHVGVRVHERVPLRPSSARVSAIKYIHGTKELSSPECADHLVPSMYGSTSKSCLEGKVSGPRPAPRSAFGKEKSLPNRPRSRTAVRRQAVSSGWRRP
eukprot:1652219-Prymnesium_polylepis.1